MNGRDVINHQPIVDILLTSAYNGNPTKHHPLMEIHQSSTYDKDPTKHLVMEIPPTIKKYRFKTDTLNHSTLMTET
jgi:hypothetical protein